MTFFNFNVLSVNFLQCVSRNNKERTTRPKIKKINNNELVFYPCSIRVNKCSGSCNNIDDPNDKFCVPDVVKNINIKVFNLMQRINEARQIIWCRCECKEDLINNEVRDIGFA